MESGRFKLLLIDLEGTLYFKGAPIPGAAEALRELAAMGFHLRFLTNTDSKTAATIGAELTTLGLRLAASEIFTPATAALAFFREHPDARCYGLLSPELATAFAP